MRTTSLRVMVIFFALMLLVLQMVDSQFVILLRPLPHASRLLGLTLSASGVGMVIAAGLIQKFRVTRPLMWMSLSSLVVGLSFGGAALLAGVRFSWGVPLVVMLGAASAALAIIPFQTALQQQTPVEWTGRVQAAVGMVSSMSIVVGPILGGLFIQRVGVERAFLWVASFLVVLGLGGSVISWSLRGSGDAKSQPTIQDGAPGDPGVRR